MYFTSSACLAFSTISLLCSSLHRFIALPCLQHHIFALLFTSSLHRPALPTTPLPCCVHHVIILTCLQHHCFAMYFTSSTCHALTPCLAVFFTSSPCMPSTPFACYALHFMNMSWLVHHCLAVFFTSSPYPAFNTINLLCTYLHRLALPLTPLTSCVVCTSLHRRVLPSTPFPWPSNRGSATRWVSNLPKVTRTDIVALPGFEPDTFESQSWCYDH